MWRSLARQWTVMAVAALLMAGCGEAPPPKGIVDHIQGYFGGVAADEPRAALIGRDTLSAGGNAVDAAVAMYFALSVTLPSSAGLGGGGVCVVFDPEKKSAETIDFTIAAPARPAPQGRWPAAVPGNVRGMFALHARYGELKWERLVQTAERLARFGEPLSRATAYEISRGRDLLRRDPVAWRIFAGADGRGAGEGSTVAQLELAATLGALRGKGPGDFYSGVLAGKIVRGIDAAGGWLAIDDLRAYRPIWRPALALPSGNDTIYFPPAPIVGGLAAAALWRAYGSGKGFRARSKAELLGVMAEAGIRSYGALGQSPLGDYGTAGFIAFDADGMAVSCAVTMNGLFGTGRMIPETGMIAAVPPSPGRNALVTLAPAVIGNSNNGTTVLAAVGAGDASASAALVSVVFRALRGGANLTDAQNAARVLPAGGQGAVLIERHAGAEERSALAGRGYAVRDVLGLGRVHIMYCPEGVQHLPDTCEVLADPRGFGHAVNAES